MIIIMICSTRASKVDDNRFNNEDVVVGGQGVSVARKPDGKVDVMLI